MLDLSDPPLDSARSAIDVALTGFCERYLANVEPIVANAIRYTLAGEGKRMRAVLLLAAHRAAGGVGDARRLAAAVEVVHAYSLVHDDLPCMDDDDVRRGRPTLHRLFGVRAATVAGVAMVPLAVCCVVDAALDLGLDEGEAAAIVRELLRAAGGGGMIGGQLEDLQAEGRRLSLAELEQIHDAKTGALISACARVGAMAARASEERVAALGRYGALVGLAFQIADDVLDVTASTDQLGKTAGRDLALRKSTYPALLGVAGASARAHALVEKACEGLEEQGLRTPLLERLARFAVTRQS